MVQIIHDISLHSSNYLYIYNLIGFKLFGLVFTLNNSLATKIKNLDGHVAKILTLIEIQFRI